MGRRAAELIGVLVASIITSYVTGLATAGPGAPALYIVGAVVPLVLLLVYWMWIEPRADAERIRSRRFARAVEDAFELSHPEADARTDVQRRAFYDRLEIGDLFEPNPVEASAALAEALDGGRRLLRRLEIEDPDGLRPELEAWEDRTTRLVATAEGTWQATALRYDHTVAPDRAALIERLDTQLVLLADWVETERKRARDQANDRFR
jgi:hypothetical protein